MSLLERNPDRAAQQSFDLIVVGGGIQGACLALEASRRGLRALLLEREDFGGATSWNSLRIIHGGLRHLQRLEFGQFTRSAIEQAWWLRNFPDLVRPLPCLMPLYNDGLRRRSVLGAALRVQRSLEGWLDRRHPRGSGSTKPTGRVLSFEETVAHFPMVSRKKLQGAALWFDALLQEPQRLQVELLRWAVACGARVLNYVECDQLLTDANRVIGVSAHCRETGERFRFATDAVVNSAGCRALGAIGAGARTETALAFNLVIDREPFSDAAVAVSPRQGSPTYFSVPYGKQTMVGTVHLAASDTSGGAPQEEQIASFLVQLNDAVPGLEMSMREVLEVHCGRLPALAPGSSQPARQARIRSDADAPSGVFSVDNVKYTTSRCVAERTLRLMFHHHWKRPFPGYREPGRPNSVARSSPIETDLRNPGSVGELARWIESESVVHIDDLLFRRFDCDREPDRLTSKAQELMEALGWDPRRRSVEVARLTEALASIGRRPTRPPHSSSAVLAALQPSAASSVNSSEFRV